MENKPAPFSLISDQVLAAHCTDVPIGPGIRNEKGGIESLPSASFGSIGMSETTATYSGKVKGIQAEIGMSGSFGLSTINPFSIKEYDCYCSM